LDMGTTEYELIQHQMQKLQDNLAKKSIGIMKLQLMKECKL
jgi:hypothetical protein